jgi:hypothetical protein
LEGSYSICWMEFHHEEERVLLSSCASRAAGPMWVQGRKMRYWKLDQHVADNWPTAALPEMDRQVIDYCWVVVWISRRRPLLEFLCKEEADESSNAARGVDLDDTVTLEGTGRTATIESRIVPQDVQWQWVVATQKPPDRGRKD